MSHYLVSQESDCTSHSFAVETKALSVVHSSSEHEPHICSELAVSGLSPPPEQLLDDAEKAFDMSNDDFRDLGDALVSILGSPANKEVQNALSEQSPRFTSVITHASDHELLQPPIPLPVYSPTASSIASSSGHEDIASILGDDKSPASIHDTAETASSEGDSSAAKPRKTSASSESDDENPAAYDSKSGKAIKLPQRKGGMQLWQFLYALLSDPQYKELIEWTSNVKEREFRLHEPECIAIWWGDHKNKRNMSYDKLSRSLRYYYDKGIIRKINGQRYVYRFCVAPEVMYRHIGNSDCRPKLKPMSIAAQNAMSKYNNSPQQMLYPSQSLPIVPGAMFNHHLIPPPYPCSYPPVTSEMTQTFCMPPESRFPVNQQLGCYFPGMKVHQFQQQNCFSQNYTHQNGFVGHFQDPVAQQPISPASQPSPTNLSTSPLPPPPYNFSYSPNPWDTLLASPISSS